MKEDPWFCVWAIIFIILYSCALGWPFVMIFIWEIEEKIQNLFKKHTEKD